MSHTEYSAQFVQYSSVFLGLEEALSCQSLPASFWLFTKINTAESRLCLKFQCSAYFQ